MLDAEQGIEKSEIIVNVKIKLAYPSPYPSPTRGEGTHFISPPLRGGDEGEGEKRRQSPPPNLPPQGGEIVGNPDAEYRGIF